MGSVLVDTGFLVALLSRDDAHHAWAAAQIVNADTKQGPSREQITKERAERSQNSSVEAALLERSNELVGRSFVGKDMHECINACPQYKERLVKTGGMGKSEKSMGVCSFCERSLQFERICSIDGTFHYPIRCHRPRATAPRGCPPSGPAHH